MPKSLDELMQSPHVGRPETEFPLCVAGKLNAEFDRIDSELDRLLSSTPDPDTGGESGPVPRVGQKTSNPRVKKLDTRREELRALMAEHMVTLLMRAREEGAWRAWKQDHPPREGDRGDERAGFNLDDLIVDIRDHPRNWVAAINGEPYTDEQWKFVWGNTSDGDQWRLAAVARQLHTTGVDIPKSLSTWLSTRTSSGSSS